MKLKQLKQLKKTPDGTFAGMKLSKDSAEGIYNFASEHNIPNILPIKDMHVTLLYSRKYLPKYKAAGKLKDPMVAKFLKFDIFKSSADNNNDVTNCLVLKLDCKELKDRHAELMNKHDATFDYDEYQPHVTISYNVGELKIDGLPPYEEEIELTTEYMNDLDLDWVDNNR